MSSGTEERTEESSDEGSTHQGNSTVKVPLNFDEIAKIAKDADAKAPSIIERREYTKHTGGVGKKLSPTRVQALRKQLLTAGPQGVAETTTMTPHRRSTTARTEGDENNNESQEPKLWQIEVIEVQGKVKKIERLLQTMVAKAQAGEERERKREAREKERKEEAERTRAAVEARAREETKRANEKAAASEARAEAEAGRTRELLAVVGQLTAQVSTLTLSMRQQQDRRPVIQDETELNDAEDTHGGSNQGENDRSHGGSEEDEEEATMRLLEEEFRRVTVNGDASSMYTREAKAQYVDKLKDLEKKIVHQTHQVVTELEVLGKHMERIRVNSRKAKMLEGVRSRKMTLMEAMLMEAREADMGDGGNYRHAHSEQLKAAITGEPEFYESLPPPWNVQPLSLKQVSNGMKAFGEKIAVPKFVGTREQYPLWRACFITSVHEAPLPLSQKMMSLLQHLEEAAKTNAAVLDLMGVVELTGEGYAEAIQVLETEYGDKDQILDQRLEAIAKISGIRVGDSIKLGKLVAQSNHYHRALRKYDQAAEFGARSFYVTLTNALTLEYKEEYMRWRVDKNREKSTTSFLDWAQKELTVYRESRPEGEACPRANKGKPQKGKGEPYKRSDKPKTNKACRLCQQEGHYTDECSKWKSMPYEERKETLTGLKGCYTCMRTGHSSKTCRTKVTCDTCKGKHHTLLHRNGETNRVLLVNTKTRTGRGRGNTGQAGSSKPEVEAPGDPAAGQAGDSRPEVAGGGEHEDSEEEEDVSVRIVRAYIEHPVTKARREVNVLLDDAAHTNLLEVKAAADIGLTGTSVWTSFEGVLGHTEGVWKVVSEIKVVSLDGTYEKVIKVNVVPKPAGSLKPIAWSERAKQYEHLKDLDIVDPIPGEGVSLLLGQLNPRLVKSFGDIDGEDDDPIARPGVFGLTVAGPKPDRRAPRTEEWPPEKTKEFRQTQKVYFAGKERTGAQNPIPVPDPWEDIMKRWLAMDIKEPWEGEGKDPSPNEKRAKRILEQGVKLKDGQFEAPVLWAEHEPELPYNYRQAEQRLHSLWKSKHFKDPKIAKLYGDKIQHQVGQKYVRRVSKSEEGKGKTYLAHFPIIKQKEDGPSVRIVMDAASKAAGKSLNQAVLTGPKAMNDLLTVLTRFRARKVAVGADVAEMFMRIRMRPEDRKYHRFLWKNAQDGEIEEYEYEAHVFGNCGSPYVAIYCIKSLATKHEESHPRAAECILKSTLMDDNLDSVDTVEEAVKLLEDLTKIYGEAGMKLGKFLSSHEEVLEGIAEEVVKPTVTMGGLGNADSAPTVKALGVVYDSKEDTFTFHAMDVETGEWTKRLMLKLYPSVYDPIGWGIPFEVRARMDFQVIWKKGYKWDQKIRVEDLVEWLKWVVELKQLNQIRFPRSLVKAPRKEQFKREIHIFCDASLKAYGAVAYLVVTYTDGTQTRRIILARARLSSTKGVTIPRLELRAAVLAVMVAMQVRDALPEDTNYTFWSDSTTVLCWLRNTSKGMGIFVARRIDYITDRTQVEDWYWVPTALNPADMISRGTTIHRLVHDKLWAHGPDYLAEGEAGYPEQPKPEMTEESKAEMKPREFEPELIFVVKETKTDISQLVPTRSWSKMLRVTALFIRWAKQRHTIKAAKANEITKTKIKDTPIGILEKSKSEMTVYKHITPLQLRPFEPEEIEEAKWAIFRNIQDLHMKELKQKIEKGEELGPKSEWAAVNPYIDEKGVMRIKGRASYNQNIPEDQRCPFIIPRNHPILEVLALHHHENTLQHVGGHAAVLDQVLEEVWTKGARVTVKRVTRGCTVCRSAKTKVTQQTMAPLPDFRLAPERQRTRPFYSTGIDVCGPFLTKFGRGKARQKRWLLLFTCTVFRAVHVEVLTSIDTSAFLMAFSRMLARRPRPAIITTDNGTNFVRGEKEIHKALRELEGSELQSKYPDIKWKFNAPNVPHCGGVFESMIKSLKQAMATVLQPGTVTDEEFATAATIAEGLLNDRPLSYVSDDMDDMRPITPADFLSGGPYTQLMPLEASSHSCFIRRWRKIQTVMDHAWKRFMQNMIPNNQEKPKWRGVQRDYQVGDVVVSLDEKDRGAWHLARIVEVYPNSKDGHTRHVKILIKGTTKEKHVNRLALLVPTEEDQQQEDVSQTNQ